MKIFKISYRDFEGEIHYTQIEAYNKEDAKSQIRQQFWDAYEIIDIQHE